MRRIVSAVCFGILCVCLSGCLVTTLDNVGRAGSDAIVVVGWREPACTPSSGGANVTLSGLKITMGGTEVPVLAIRDVIDTEVETRDGVKMPPPMTYRVARIKIPADMPPGKTQVRIYCDGKEATEKGVSPLDFEVLPGPGRTEADLEGAKGLK